MSKEDENLKRLAFLEKKIEKCKKELVEMESLSVKMQQTYCDNLDIIDQCEKEITEVKNTPFCGNFVHIAATDGAVLTIPRTMFEQSYSNVYDIKERACRNYHIDLIPKGLTDEEIGDITRDVMLQSRSILTKRLKKQNEMIIANLEDLTKDYK